MDGFNKRGKRKRERDESLIIPTMSLYTGSPMQYIINRNGCGKKEPGIFNPSLNYFKHSLIHNEIIWS